MEVIGILIPIVIAIGSIWYLMKIARQAREQYGFGMILNWSFLLVVIGLIAGAITIGLASERGNELNAVVLALAAIGSIVGAGAINIRRSTPQFGTLFTFLQVVAAIGIIVPIILIISHKTATRGIRNMN